MRGRAFGAGNFTAWFRRFGLKDGNMITLHSYWRSGAAYRVRIGLALKGLSYKTAAHDLRAGAQHDPEFLALNPQGLVPAIESEGMVFTQSPAIFEWLDEVYPNPPLLPKAPAERAQVRALAAQICCDIHPLNNLRVLNALRSDLGGKKEHVLAWTAKWIGLGFAALEPQIARCGGAFAWGDSATVVDCCLVPQVYSAERFGVDLGPYPAIRRVAEHCRALEPFRAAHPEAQPDFAE